MGKAILMSGGTSGVGSDDVTASKAQVLQGYKTVTTDSNDEVAEGTIKIINTADDNYNINKSNAFGLDGFGRMWIDMPHGNGYYYRYDNKPHTCIDSVKLGDATADKVLDGNTFTSKNGIAMKGTIANRGNVANTVEFVNAHWESKFLARTEPGYYSQNGPWKPCVAIPYAVLASTAGVDANKMLSNLTVAGITGNIKMVNTQDSNYRINKSSAFGIDNWSDINNPVFWIDFPYGNGYYHRNDGHPHICINADNLGTAGADSVLQGQTATSQHGVKFDGAIRRWICTTGDVITALGGEGFVWDDGYAGRGRGIVSKIPNNHYIQGANYVFLPSPNLLAENVRENVNINGVTGTLPDYRVGRPVFENATFNTLYVGGVANKDFPQARIMRDRTYKSIIQNYVRYTGIKDGGICIEFNAGGSLELHMGSDYVGFVLDRAILINFFRQVKITYKLDLYMYTGGYQRRAGITVGAGLYNAANKVGIRWSTASHDSSDHIENVHDTSTHELIINAADVNGDTFLSLYANAYSDFNQSYARGKIIFTKIELVN